MQGRLSRLLARCGGAIVCSALAACGSGDGFGPAGGGGPLQPTFSSIQANVLTPMCEQCHSGASAPHGLRLDAANSYAMLVGVPSDEVPAILRVKAGDPAASYLIQKLEGTASEGERMPAGLPPLPQSTIDVVRQWIADGALRDTPPSTAPIRVTSLSPLPGSGVATLPASITASFDRDLNATTVDVTTFTLLRSGDGIFGNGNDLSVTPASVSVPAANQRSAVMSLAGLASVNDTYRVTLRGAAPAAILDLGGNALDGEFASTFPSGNGTAGGDFVAEFRVGVAPTLQSIQANIFTPTCSVAGCHDGGGSQLPRSIDLRNETASRTSLAGVPSVQVPALQRVAPGNAADSYVIRKLEGGPGILGQRMPFNGPPYLDQNTINAIREWINNGAM
jgi:Big-like domain-containing protein